jgi:hypothetical protein
MYRMMAIVAMCGILTTTTLAADEPARTKPIGTWERTSGDHTATFKFTADSVRCTLSGSGGALIVDADYGVTKDGTLFGLVTKVDKRGTEFGPEVGTLFRFRIKLDKDRLTVSELEENNSEAKQILMGDYTRKKE